MVVSLNCVIPSKRVHLVQTGLELFIVVFVLLGVDQGLLQGHQATPPDLLLPFLYLSSEILLNKEFSEIHSIQGSQEKCLSLYLQRNHIIPVAKYRLSHYDLGLANRMHFLMLTKVCIYLGLALGSLATLYLLFCNKLVQLGLNHSC